MAGGITAFTEGKLLGLLYGSTAWVIPDTYYVGFSTAAFSRAATGAASNEVSDSGTGYDRIAINNDTAQFTLPAGSEPATLTTLLDIVFGIATADWGTILSMYGYDDPTVGSGNAIWGCDAAAAYPITAGTTPQVSAGTQNFTLL